jgi:uncharacterized protein YqhQ
MPKASYNPEKTQQKKKIIGIIAIMLLLILMIIRLIFPINVFIWIPLALAICGVANLLLRRVGKTPL